MANIGGCFQDGGGIMRFKGLYQPVVLILYHPWYCAIFIKCISCVALNGIVPVLRDAAKRLFAVVIGIQKMPRALQRVNISAFIRVYGVLGKILNIGLVEISHAFGQRKNSKSVNAMMRVKAP